MSWIAVGIGAAVSLYGASQQTDAASDASDAQVMSGERSLEEQRRQYDLTREDTRPWREGGEAGVRRLRQLLGLDQDYAGADSGSLLRRFSADDLNADPVYQSGLQFGLNEGTRGINARAIAGGGYDSGATLRALTRYGNDYGSTKANESYNRFNTDAGNIYNRLAGISGTGQTAVGQVTTAGTNSTNAISETLMGQGNARAAGIVGGANAWGSGVQNLNGLYNNYQSNQTLRGLMGNRNSTPSSTPTYEYGGGSDNWY